MVFTLLINYLLFIKKLFIHLSDKYCSEFKHLLGSRLILRLYLVLSNNISSNNILGQIFN